MRVLDLIRRRRRKRKLCRAVLLNNGKVVSDPAEPVNGRLTFTPHPTVVTAVRVTYTDGQTTDHPVNAQSLGPGDSYTYGLLYKRQ